MAIYLCGLPEVSSKLAGRAARVSSPLLDLAPEKGCLATALLQIPVVSYTAFSPLPFLAVCFCGPV